MLPCLGFFVAVRAKPKKRQFMRIHPESTGEECPPGKFHWANVQIINRTAFPALEMMMVGVRAGTLISGFSRWKKNLTDKGVFEKQIDCPVYRGYAGLGYLFPLNSDFMNFRNSQWPQRVLDYRMDEFPLPCLPRAHRGRCLGTSF